MTFPAAAKAVPEGNQDARGTLGGEEASGAIAQ